MAGSATGSDEKNSWTYAFVILLLVSVAMLTLRFLGKEILVLEFEIALIYFPTVLSGIIAAYVNLRGAKQWDSTTQVPAD
jgi:hypothetical protein